MAEFSRVSFLEMREERVPDSVDILQTRGAGDVLFRFPLPVFHCEWHQLSVPVGLFAGECSLHEEYGGGRVTPGER